MRAAQSGCTSASVLTIWQRRAGSLRRVFLPFGMRVRSAERMHLSGCSYHLACVCVQRKAGALQRVFLPFGSAERVRFGGCSCHLACVCAVLSGCTSAGVLTIWHACVCSAKRVHFRGCCYHLACVCAAQSGCTSAGVLTMWLACVQRQAGALPGVFFPFGTRVCSAERMHFSGCSYQFGMHVCGAKRVHFSKCSYGALQRVLLPFGMRVCSDQQVHLLRRCSYHVGRGENHFDLRVGKYPVPFSGGSSLLEGGPTLCSPCSF